MCKSSVRGRNSESIDAESNTNANHSLRFCVSQRKERNLQYYLYLVRAWTSSVTDKNSAAGVVRVHSFCRGKISKEHQVFVLTTFWSHSLFITKQTHGSMESICWVGKWNSLSLQHILKSSWKLCCSIYLGISDKEKLLTCHVKLW